MISVVLAVSEDLIVVRCKIPRPPMSSNDYVGGRQLSRGGGGRSNGQRTDHWAEPKMSLTDRIARVYQGG